MNEIKEKLDQIIELLQVIAGDKLPQHMWSQQRSAAEGLRQSMAPTGQSFTAQR